jgi:hypothetical protein
MIPSTSLNLVHNKVDTTQKSILIQLEETSNAEEILKDLERAKL